MRKIFFFFPILSISLCAEPGIRPNTAQAGLIRETLCRYDKSTPDFSVCFGQPLYTMPSLQRKALLIYFSALTCPQCALFYQTDLCTLIQKTQEKALRIVIRDYPIDGISMRASACIWSLNRPPKKRHFIFQSVFQQQEKWMKKIGIIPNAISLKQTMKAIEDTIMDCENIQSQKEKKCIQNSHQDTSNTSVMKQLFDAHNVDQHLFNIQGTPFAVLIMQDINGSYTMQTFFGNDMKNSLMDAVNRWLK